MSQQELYFLGKKYLSIKKASDTSGYTRDYVGQLCRGGKIKCERVSNSWFVNEKDIGDHKNRKKIKEDCCEIKPENKFKNKNNKKGVLRRYFIFWGSVVLISLVLFSLLKKRDSYKNISTIYFQSGEKIYLEINSTFVSFSIKTFYLTNKVVDKFIFKNIPSAFLQQTFFNFKNINSSNVITNFKANLSILQNFFVYNIKTNQDKNFSLSENNTIKKEGIFLAEVDNDNNESVFIIKSKKEKDFYLIIYLLITTLSFLSIGNFFVRYKIKKNDMSY